MTSGQNKILQLSSKTWFAIHDAHYFASEDERGVEEGMVVIWTNWERTN